MGNLLRNCVLIAGCTAFTGIAFNLLVMLANGGLMPVSVPGLPEGMMLYGGHAIAGVGTRFFFLCDYIPVWRPGGVAMESPGDLLQDLGTWLGIPSMLGWWGTLVAQKVWAFCKTKAL